MTIRASGSNVSDAAPGAPAARPGRRGDGGGGAWRRRRRRWWRGWGRMLGWQNVRRPCDAGGRSNARHPAATNGKGGQEATRMRSHARRCVRGAREGVGGVCPGGGREAGGWATASAGVKPPRAIGESEALRFSQRRDLHSTPTCMRPRRWRLRPWLARRVVPVRSECATEIASGHVEGVLAYMTSILMTTSSRLGTQCPHVPEQRYPISGVVDVR